MSNQAGVLPTGVASSDHTIKVYPPPAQKKQRIYGWGYMKVLLNSHAKRAGDNRKVQVGIGTMPGRMQKGMQNAMSFPCEMLRTRPGRGMLPSHAELNAYKAE